MTYLGIDYGESHVGIAISEGVLAEPLATFPAKSAISSLKKLIITHRVDQLVVGDCPESFLNSLSHMGIPVVQADESLSSFDARVSLAHTTKTRRKNLEHQAAAAIILSSWLDSEGSKS